MLTKNAWKNAGNPRCEPCLPEGTANFILLLGRLKLCANSSGFCCSSTNRPNAECNQCTKCWTCYLKSRTGGGATLRKNNEAQSKSFFSRITCGLGLESRVANAHGRGSGTRDIRLMLAPCSIICKSRIQTKIHLFDRAIFLIRSGHVRSVTGCPARKNATSMAAN
jgi:hypothetical protein